MSRGVLILGLLAAVQAHVPLPRSLARRATIDDTCKRPALDDSDPSIAADTWNELGVSNFLDGWFADHDKLDNWMNTLDYEVAQNGESGYQCTEIPGSCDIPDDCDFYYNQGWCPAYWALYAGASAHGGLAIVSDELHNSALYEAFQIDKMVEDYGAVPEGQDFNVFALISSAFTVSLAATVTSPYLTAPIILIVGIFGILGQFFHPPEPVDPTNDLKAQYGDAFEAAKTQIDDIISALFGGGDGLDPQGLPGQIESFKHPISRFFAEGRFLKKDWGNIDIQKGSLSSSIPYQQRGIASIIMKYLNVLVVVNTYIHDAGTCNGFDSTYWQESTGRCFYSVNSHDGQDGANEPFSTDDSSVMRTVNDYGLSLDDFYGNAYDCAENNQDGGGQVSTDFGDYPTDGTYPRCFFNMDVLEADMNFPTSSSGAWIDKISGLNTGGFSDPKPPPDGSGGSGPCKRGEPGQLDARINC